MANARYAVVDYITNQVISILRGNAIEIVSLKLRDDHEEDIDIIELPNYRDHYAKYLNYHTDRHPETEPQEAMRYAEKMIMREMYVDADTILRKLCPKDEPCQLFVQGVGLLGMMAVSITTANYDVQLFTSAFPANDKAFFLAFAQSN